MDVKVDLKESELTIQTYHHPSETDESSDQAKLKKKASPKNRKKPKNSQGKRKNAVMGTGRANLGNIDEHDEDDSENDSDYSDDKGILIDKPNKNKNQRMDSAAFEPFAVYDYDYDYDNDNDQL